MCTLAVYSRAFPDHPLVIAANRDEFLARPSASPQLLDIAGEIFGGRDEMFGGTWFGVQASGMAAALLNRRSEAPPDPSRRSRGLLCLDVLRCRTQEAARRLIEKVEAVAYNPFNLLVADRESAWVATNHAGRLEITDLSPGLHLLTNLDLNDPTCPRIAGSYRLFAAVLDERRLVPGSDGFVERMRRILSSHDTALDPRSDAPGNSLCLHLGQYGTRSSTLAFLHRGGKWTYLHSNQAPCRGKYVAAHGASSLHVES